MRDDLSLRDPLEVGDDSNVKFNQAIALARAAILGPARGPTGVLRMHLFPELLDRGAEDQCFHNNRIYDHRSSPTRDSRLSQRRRPG